MSKAKRNRKRNRRSARKSEPIKQIDLHLPELRTIVDRTAVGPLGTEDRGKLGAAIDSLAFLASEIQAKGASIRRLRKMIFGSETEKTSKVFPDSSKEKGKRGKDSSKKSGKKRKGHGRNGAAAYRGAKKVLVDHPTLKPGDPCPDCGKGKLYRLKKPAVIVRVTGVAPISATVYERERLRCKLCQKVFTAPAPEGVGAAKYDEKSASMIALLKYGCGLPFNRLERLERELGIPLPAATQWEVVREAADLLKPVHEELIRQAAQGEVLHNDDTTIKILDLEKRRQEVAPGEKADKRKGMFTSGIVATRDGHKIALFFSGCRHAGENLEQVLARRAPGLPIPIQMSDALPVNHSGDFETIVASCMVHARRKFVDVADNFPDECRHVIEELRKVFRNDAHTREQSLSAEERLSYHVQKSKPLLDKLQKWLNAQLDERKVEPNSGLGEAIGYMLRHWDALTLFTCVPGAPLDNNIVERALKRAILHRKNACFYKTQTGADVGDLFMSMIHTAELCDVDVFDYLTALQENAREAGRNPGAWMPWNYSDRRARMDKPPK